MDICQVEACEVEVSRKGFKLCLEHWRADQAGVLAACGTCGRLKEDQKPLCYACFKAASRGSGSVPEAAPNKAAGSLLSSTQLGAAFDVSAQRVNLALAELGWISKEPKGWSATRQGLKLGAVQKEHSQSGVPYVYWPEAIVKHKALRTAMQELYGELVPELLADVPSKRVVAPALLESAPSPAEAALGFRDKFEAPHRAQDGHRVRSKAEALIDNWLYQASIVHAYERRLPIEEEVYSDFWIPSGKVYIEYWGMESNLRYAERKKVKQELYKKYGFSLIELHDEEIRNLDDHLPRMLRAFGVHTP
ncbi:hypothetical protein SAMN05443572_1042 [Myxococcus fulvus]|uniref:DUF559 domain-containing protein n=1 Tax=Myxococcus fulvus TaxID=33 RepID=A0A511SZP3_MYXFU|nr:hypothetical protein [Myxococcus fulvus]GEN07380.1 hypothetical protein MFU01_24170 [Myxococcus fulvus]SET94695.1 hypothetical protein SAMN05443572_1042 [Myxococcus fulvus]